MSDGLGMVLIAAALATAGAALAREPRTPDRLLLLLGAPLLLGLLALVEATSSATYDMWVEEDRWIEWGTFAAFAMRAVGFAVKARAADAALTRVMREATGSVYVHCHHGKHRGPAAAAICGRAAGSLDQAAATRLLELAQTSPDYDGLWRDVVDDRLDHSVRDVPVIQAPVGVTAAEEDRGGVGQVDLAGIELRGGALRPEEDQQENGEGQVGLGSAHGIPP